MSFQFLAGKKQIASLMPLEKEYHTKEGEYTGMYIHPRPYQDPLTLQYGSCQTPLIPINWQLKEALMLLECLVLPVSL